MYKTAIIKRFFRFHTMRSLFIYLISFGFSISLLQAQVKVGQWTDHLAYNHANAVARVGSTVYFSNGSGLAKYNLGDNSIEKFTKIQGLSDVGVKLLRKNDYNDVLLVIYENTNIDVVLPSGVIYNISDIKRKIIPGLKTINEVYFKGPIAYLACGFGIVEFDTDKLEIKNTLNLGNGISNYEVYQLTTNDTALFAATPLGIFYGNNNANLSNYQNWKPLMTGLPAGPYNSIVYFDNKVITNYSEKMKSGQSFKDTLYQYDGISWTKYPYKSSTENIKLYDYSKYNKLLILDQWGLQDYSPNGVFSTYITNYGFDVSRINDVYFDGGNQYWIADNSYGLVNSKGGGGGLNSVIGINGPENSLCHDIDINDGVLAVAPVDLGVTYTYQYLRHKPSIYQNGEWFSLKNALSDTLWDVNTVAVDPNDKNHVIFGCMDRGVVSVRNKQFDRIYNSGNTPLIGYNGTSDLRVSGVAFDKNSNIWVSITIGKKCVSVIKTNNTYALLDFEQFIVQPTVAEIIFDKHDQAWIVLARTGGILIYKDVNGLSQPNASNTKLVTLEKGKGALPSNDIYSICEDHDGHIWVGTSKGITVFYNPENVFTGANWDSQQILIEQDGHVQILLENDFVTAIAVDGANRKWIGTQTSGVYCFSPDGQSQVYHFTTDNSPLYSNDIKDIVTDETTGDVFIATEKGIQAYRTAIIKGYENFENMHAYPNPVRPGFAGPVYITGLIDEAIVKITDIAGNLVWQTKSEGGQVEWNLQTFSGTKVASGVYMVYCSSANGDKSATSKLLVIN